MFQRIIYKGQVLAYVKMQDKKVFKNETKFCTMYPRAPIYFLLLRGDDKYFMCFGLCCSHQVDTKFSMCSHLVNKLWVF